MTNSPPTSSFSRAALLVLALSIVTAGCGRSTSTWPASTSAVDRTPIEDTTKPAGDSAQADEPRQAERPKTEVAAPTVPQDTPRSQTQAPAIDARQLAAAGIRRLDGRHLTLYTDVEPSAEVDALPELFDRAVPAWCAYFGVPAERAESWHVVGCLMQDKERFLATGLLPDSLPPFPNGWGLAESLWLYEQQSDYYRRHLLLHEGTHSFMHYMLGGCGPPWFMEGTAELLGTHRLAGATPELGWFPARREDVPLLGRIKHVQDAVVADASLRAADVLALEPQAFLHNDAYAWSWAFAHFLEQHPRYGDRFRQLAIHVRDTDFNDRFRERFALDWPHLQADWEVFVRAIEHGYDFDRTAIDFTPGEALAVGGVSVTIAADRGWQSSGVRLQPGTTYRLTATGRYQVDDEPQIWWCEPGGVTIRYYQGRPLGILLAAVYDESTDVTAEGGLADPIAVGLGTTITPSFGGTLMLKINDSAAELHNNAGSLQVEILRE